jgi:phospholipase A1
MFGSNIDTYFAYTAQSWWQLSNDDISAPFRETNYEPEIFLRSFTEYNLFGWKLAGWTLGFNHQSNGRSEPLSRSWNRVVGRFGLEASNNLSFLVRAWHRIEEDEEDDDNPNTSHYYGYGDIRAIWTPNRNTFTAMLRPGTEETSYELTWSYPIGEVFRVYTQYYDGFGESLVDYDYENRRFGIGIALNDYLMRN